MKKLEEAMGEKSAATLMEYLPANGWRDVATVTDLDNLRLELRGEMRAGFSDVRANMARLEGKMEARMAQGMRTMTVAFVGGLVYFGGLLVAAAAIFKP